MKIAYVFCVFLLALPMVLTAQLTNPERTTTVRLVADMSTMNEAPPVTGVQGNGTAEIVINLTRTTSTPDVDPQADDENFLDDILGFGVPTGAGGDSRFSEVRSAAVEFRGDVNLGLSRRSCQPTYRRVAGRFAAGVGMGNHFTANRGTSVK